MTTTSTDTTAPTKRQSRKKTVIIRLKSRHTDIYSRNIGISMAARTYFDRTMPRRNLGGFYTGSLSALNDVNAYSSMTNRRLRQHHSNDTKAFSHRSFSISPSPSPPSLPKSSVTAMPLSEPDDEQSTSTVHSISNSQLASTSLNLMGSTLKCDDCQTNDGLFQCCHCSQRLCIRCCNKHYKKVTVELERLHELSDRLVAKIVHTKNDLERQKNETLEQCHKWRVDTINTINKAHALIVQTIHNEYDVLGKEYEIYVQKEMAHLNVDQNEIIRMKKGNLGSLLSSPSSSMTDSTNSIEMIRKRIEAFAKNIDETGKFLFHVQLPTFDIDDRLRVESRFGDVTRCTSATWQNDSSTLHEDHLKITTDRTNENDQSSTSSKNDVNLTNNQNEDLDELPVEKTDENDSDLESHTTSSSSKSESYPADVPSSRYALSVENDIELQQQQFYRPSFRGDRYDSAYGTAPSSPNNSFYHSPEHFASSSSLHDHSSKKFSSTSNQPFGSFYNNRRHTHTFHRTASSSPTFTQTDENEDTYRSVQHVQLKREQDGSLEGVAVQVEQSQKTEGTMKQSRTCVEACAIRRRTTAIPPRSPSSNRTRSSNDQPWLYYRTISSPSFHQ